MLAAYLLVVVPTNYILVFQEGLADKDVKNTHSISVLVLGIISDTKHKN